MKMQEELCYGTKSKYGTRNKYIEHKILMKQSSAKLWSIIVE